LVVANIHSSEIYTLEAFELKPAVIASKEHTDLELLAGIALGDNPSFEELFRRYYEPLSHYAYKYVRDRVASEDIVQDVFLKLWNKREALKDDVALKPYLYVAVRNTSLNHIKIASRKATIEDDKFDPLFVNSRTAEDDLQFQELEQKVMAAINQLPPKCREVFVLSRYEDKSYKEIAETLEISVKTVENQMGKALRKMRESLGAYLKIMLFLVFFGVF